MKQRPRIYYTDSQKALMWERWRQGKITLLMHGRTDYLTDRYSERNERARAAIDRQIEKL